MRKGNPLWVALIVGGRTGTLLQIKKIIYSLRVFVFVIKILTFYT